MQTNVENLSLLSRNKTVARPNCSPQEKNSKIDKRWVCLFWTLEYVYLAI